MVWGRIGVTTLHPSPGHTGCNGKQSSTASRKTKSFVYGAIRFTGEGADAAIEVGLRPRRNSRPVCSGCGRRGPRYDRLKARRFEFVHLWAITAYFVYRMNRVDCRRGGVTVEQVPWGEGQCHLTKTYRWFLAAWAKRLSWQEVAVVFRTSWQSVYRSVRHAVTWGLVNRPWVWFVEGFNNKAKLATKKGYGFRTYEAIETALYHQLGKLPEPNFTHKFW